MSVAGDQKWDDLFAGDGYLFFKPENSSLPQEPWGVSMFHGLHCLQVLRSKIQDLEAQVSGSDLFRTKVNMDTTTMIQMIPMFLIYITCIASPILRR